MIDERREVGARIAEARRAGGLTQRELAEKLGVTIRSVQNYEAGAVVPYKHLRTIEMLGRKRAGWLLEGGEDGSSALFASIGALHEAMERHQLLMQRHLEEMRTQMDRLRGQREAAAERRSRE